MTRFEVHGADRHSWLPRLKRAHDLTLGGLGSASSLQVTLHMPDSGNAGGELFRCELVGRYSPGIDVNVVAAHADGQLAIHHVFARARRQLLRRRYSRSLPVRAVT